MDIDGLFHDALAALRKEDQCLRDCFKKSDTTVAHGLAYWLFETTLVYFIFKAWLPKVNVLWEHVIEKEVGRRPNPGIVGRSGAHEKCDLVIMHDGVVVAAFEAKWWNNSSSKTRSSLMEDANKLRRGFPSKAVDKYLLTFWWGDTTNGDKDMEAARAACQEEDFELVKHGKFGTKLLDGRDGYFAMGLLKVD